MTPAEAAKILEALEDSLCQSAEYNDDWSDAFDLAIAALEENTELHAENAHLRAVLDAAIREGEKT